MYFQQKLDIQLEKEALVTPQFFLLFENICMAPVFLFWMFPFAHKFNPALCAVFQYNLTVWTGLYWTRCVWG